MAGEAERDGVTLGRAATALVAGFESFEGFAWVARFAGLGGPVSATAVAVAPAMTATATTDDAAHRMRRRGPAARGCAS